MDAGQLRHRVTIQRKNPQAQDAETGDLIAAWESLRTVWASFEPLSGRELMAAHAQQSEISARMKMRHTDVTPKDRILFKDRVFVIHAVLADLVSNKHYLTLMVSEGVGHE